MKNKKEILKEIPRVPGIYKFFDEKDELIYIGKATNLKSRISSYFSPKNKETSPWRSKMKEKIARLETVVCENPVEALVLETNLIKSLRPKFNVLMKDDKNLTYIKVTREEYPRVELVRRVLSDKSFYFGPKTSRGSAKKTLELLRKIFPFRVCENLPKAPCLDFHINKCLGPCTGKVSKDQYDELIKGVLLFLKGKYAPIMKIIKEEIENSMKKMQFERCQRLKKQYLEIKTFHEKQRVSDPNWLNCDAIGFFEELGILFVNLLKIRDGKVIDTENFTMKSTSGDEVISKKLSLFVQNFYSISTEIPDSIILPREIDDSAVLEKWLSQKKSSKFKFEISPRGQKDGILNFAYENAKDYARKNRISFLSSKRDLKNAYQVLAKDLGISSAKRMECFDISHISGEHTVASSVAFLEGTPEKSFYRRYKIKNTKDRKIDDFACMEEVLERRYRDLLYFNEEASRLLGRKSGEIVFSASLEKVKKNKAKSKKDGSAWIVKDVEYSDAEILDAGLFDLQERAEREKADFYFVV